MPPTAAAETERDLRIEELAEARLAPHLGREAFLEVLDGESRSVTWGEVLRQAHDWSLRLRRRGLLPGDRVLLCSPNSAAWEL